MAALFQRTCSLVVSTVPANDDFRLAPTALKIENLRMRFEIDRDDKPNPNNAKIVITNLNANSRHAVEQKGVRIVLTAGYQGGTGQLFSGDVRYGNTEKISTDIDTVLECGDGERAFAVARVNESFKPGTSVKDVLTAIAKKLVLDKGNLAEKIASLPAQFANGYVAHGLASNELTQVLKPHGLSWSIQDGRIQALAKNEAITGTVPLVSTSTGMIGTPKLAVPEKKGKPAYLKVRMLLQPEIWPGSKFEVKSVDQHGLYRARKVKHTGDTHGTEWYTDVEAVHLS